MILAGRVPRLVIAVITIMIARALVLLNGILRDGVMRRKQLNQQDWLHQR